jgi:hypothetical protein
MGWVLISNDPDRVAVIDSDDRRAVNISGGDAALEKAVDAFEHFAGRFRRVNLTPKLAAVPHAMGEPASELLHFANAIGLIRSFNFPVVAGE